MPGHAVCVKNCSADLQAGIRLSPKCGSRVCGTVKPMPARADKSVMQTILRIAAAMLTVFVVVAAGASTSSPWLRPAAAPAPDDNHVTAARVELGRALFFDPRLSAKGSLSCASCHNPALGWSDGLPTAVGHNMKVLARSTPTIVNAAFNPLQMWDGRKGSLEEQALGPFGADEQNLPLEELERRVQSIAGYGPMFAAAYPDEPITRTTIAKAIASFERTVLSDGAPFDQFIAGDKDALSPAARRGFDLFVGKANCAACHQGFNFTDNGFHNVGVRDSGSPDVGRFAFKKLASMQGAFKTPTLRDIALTAPYMHNGSYVTLEEVVEHYVRGGDVKDNLSPNVKPLDLSAQEKSDLVAFMRSLTSAPRVVSVPALPR
jgi:cytochrome c peroxidase